MRRNSGIMATRFYFFVTEMQTTDNERIFIKNR